MFSRLIWCLMTNFLTFTYVQSMCWLFCNLSTLSDTWQANVLRTVESRPPWLSRNCYGVLKVSPLSSFFPVFGPNYAIFVSKTLELNCFFVGQSQASFTHFQSGKSSIKPLSTSTFWTNKLCFQLHTYFLIIDDIIDHSDTRRGAVCWYRQPGIGLTAVNDAVMMENGVYLLLKKYV